MPGKPACRGDACREAVILEMRALGRTGERVSVLGAGGYHLLDVTQRDVEAILNRYLDAGGNYIESSADYGNGHSEEKIGRAVSARRDEFLLGTKVNERDAEGARKTLEASLRRLRTDHVDIWFMHAVQYMKDLEQLLAPGGAVEEAERAREQGKVRYIGISGHGHPVALIDALDIYEFDVVLNSINYYDRFNFPANIRHAPPARGREENRCNGHEGPRRRLPGRLHGDSRPLCPEHRACEPRGPGDEHRRYAGAGPGRMRGPLPDEP